MTENGSVPSSLHPGDTIAFVSPSARLNDTFPRRIARAREQLEKQGYNVKMIFTSTLSDDFLTSIHQRCDELHQAFADPSIKAIFSTIGGLSTNELLPHLDYELIKKNPKIFCGYSDITLLHHAFLTQANLRTFYGPAGFIQLGEYPSMLDFTREHFTKVLTLNEPAGPVPRSIQWTQDSMNWEKEETADQISPRKLFASPLWRWLRTGKCNGRLFGGCLPSVAQLGGTKYMPSYRDKILFLETPEGDGENVPFGLDFARSSMADLRNIGVFDGIVGLILGRPYKYDEKMRAEFEQMVTDQCYGMDIPILTNVDVGHTDPILTLPMNALCSLDSDKNEFIILEAAVTLPT